MEARSEYGKAHLLMTHGPSGDPGKTEFQGVSLSLTVESESEAKQYFESLAKDGKVQMLFAKTFFSTAFGMVSDKFGIWWMVYTKPAE